MKDVFASTTALLATEFVEKFTETRLNFTLSKVGRKTGVKFSRSNNTVSIFGLWPWILEAHDILLGDVRNLEGMSDDENADLNETVDDNEESHNHSGSSADFKAGNCAKKGDIPEPVIYYEYKEKMLVGQDIMSPEVLVDVVTNVTNFGEAASLKNIIREKYQKSKEGEGAFEKHQLEIENPSKSETKETEENASVEVKVEKTNDYAEDTSIYDGDTDEMTDTETVSVDINKRPSRLCKKTKAVSKKKAKAGQIREKGISNTSRRKSTPKKYIAPKKEDIKQETGITEGENTALTQPATKKNVVKSRKRGRKKIPQNTSETFPCEECPYVGKGKSHLREHKRRQHGIRFKCDQCDRTFGFNKDLNRHKRTVHVAAEHFCEDCNRFYKSKRVYDEHIKCHQVGYVKPSFACKMCVKKFSTKYVLASHIRAEHLGMKRSYLCPTCGRSFTQKNSYRQHANVHAGIRPYVCDICGKAFTYEKSLKEHKFLHEDIRRFHCEICGKSFLQSTSLRIHMKVHQEARDYMCTACGKGFTQKQALMRHERIHSGDKPYSCSLCAKQFSDYSIIRRHMILIHKKDPKKWQEGIVSNLRRKEGYYIDGGPGHHYRTSSQKTPQKALTEDEYIAQAVDKAIKEVSDAAIEHEDSSLDTEAKLAHTDQVDVKTFCELDNYTEIKASDNVSSYSSNRYGAPNVMEENSQSSSVSDKAGVIKDTPMPINYSIQPSSSYSPNVSSGPTQDHISQESLVSRYQQLEDMYSRDLQHQRGLYVPASTPDQMRSQLQSLQYAAPVTADQGQSHHSQPAHNQWSFLGYPSYYNPANFPQYQGPQN